MSISQRLNLPDYSETTLQDVAPDDELPSYDVASAPAYDSDGFNAAFSTYRLCQVNRKTQLFVAGASSITSYSILLRGSMSFFSKKPDVEVSRVRPNDVLANLFFLNDGPLPWRPRAIFSHIDSFGVQTYPMESRNFSDWTFSAAGSALIWQLEGSPMSLALRDQSTGVAFARFTYSEFGTRATGGNSVGELVIYQEGLGMGPDGTEQIICSLLIPLGHFKKMGRHYWNDPAS